MVNKTLRTDIEILRKILKHQEGLNETMKMLNLFSLNDIIANNVALKALALDIGQIGELTDKLTEDTIDSFRRINVKLAYSIRNRMDHAYLSVKPQEIALTAMQLSGKDSIDEIKSRMLYCVSCSK
ncbi:MAG: hypothetical protein K0S47_3133 [Herbinix sp.]|nr:hypothetical protein [Herbinix sp.]